MCCLQLPGFSQFLGKEFNSFTTNDLLSDNKITAITQDRFGYMWIGTEHGLNRFDGVNFKQYHAAAAKETLPSEDILKLLWIDGDNLAIITGFGINLLNIQSMKQSNLVIPPDSLKFTDKVNTIRDLLIDKSGNFYIATRTGFYHLNAKKELIFRYDDYSYKELASGAAAFGTFLGWLDDHNIIVNGQHGIYTYNIDKRIFSKITSLHPFFSAFAIRDSLKENNYTTRQPWKGCFILFMNNSDTAIYIDENKKLLQYSRLPISPVDNEISWRSELYVINDSSLYITGKYSGIFKLHLNRIDGSLKLDSLKYFNTLECNAFFLDAQGKAWVGSNKGLLAEKKNLLQLQFGKLPDSIAMGNPVIATQQIATDEKYVYTVATVSGGMYIFNKNDLSYKKTVFFKFIEKTNISLYAILKWGKDTILCGGGSGLFWYNTRNDKSGRINLPGWDIYHNWIANMYLDNNKNLWITSNNSGGSYIMKKESNTPIWFSFNQPLVKNIQVIYRMDADTLGNIWMAGNGLARFNTKKWMFDLYVDSFPAFRWQRKAVISMACDKDGSLWIGNATNGLVYFNPGKKSFTLFTTADGLPDNTILALKRAGEFLWIACRNGVAKMDLGTGKIYNTINNRELLTGTIRGNRFFYDSGLNTIYMGVGSGILRFKNVIKNNSIQPPHLIIENILLGKDSVIWNPSGSITTSWKNKNITLVFNAINYEDPQDQRYAYRIVSRSDSDWVSLEKQRSIVIDNLNTGRHLIEIKVFSINNNWPPQFINIGIIVKEPFWKTWWFLLLCALMISTIIYSFFRYRINQLKVMIGVREKLSQDLHDEVGATLSGIAMYSHLTLQQIKAEQPGEVKKSLQIIQQSAIDTVSRLSDIVWSVNPLHDSLKKLLEKLEEYAIEMSVTKDIKVNVNIPSGRIANLKLPMQTRKNIYLICKEAINNAVKYSNASILELTVKDFDHSLEFTIKNDGKGFDFDTIKRGNGLENMQKRADEIGAKLLLQSKENEGASVCLQCKIG